MTNFYVTVFGNFVMALIIASVFYNMQPTTETFYRRGALLFFAVLTNAFASMLEVCIFIVSSAPHMLILN